MGQDDAAFWFRFTNGFCVSQSSGVLHIQRHHHILQIFFDQKKQYYERDHFKVRGRVF